MAHPLTEANLIWPSEKILDFEQRCLNVLPSGQTYQTEWRLDQAHPNGEYHAYFCVTSKLVGQHTINFMIGFRRYRGDGDVVINAGYYELGDLFQNDARHHYGSNMARFVFAYALEIDAERVTVCANLDIGSYAWARKFTRPFRVDQMKAILRRRSQKLLEDGHWTEAEFFAVRRILESGDPDFIARIAGLRRYTSSFESDLPKFHPGFQILSAYPLGELRWDGYWNLRDTSHIKIIERALYET